MDLALRLCCVLALLCCLASTGNAGAIDRDRQKIQELQRRSEQNSDPYAQLEITNEAVEIYKKYRGKRRRMTKLNSLINDFEARIQLAARVSKQGRVFTDFLTNLCNKNIVANIAKFLQNIIL